MELYIDQVGKKYNQDFWALKDFTLTLNPGVVALLGPNGAGKTTLMSILATTTRASTGKVLWNGVDIAKKPNALRTVLGYLPQYFGIYPNLNAMEFLEYIAALKGLGGRGMRKRIEELLHLVNLYEVRKRPMGGYSGGMKQRVGIAQALLNDPKLLIVDEPTVGLDPEERVRFRNLLSDLAGERIILLSTHIVSDAESTATNIAVIKTGHLVEYAEPAILLREVEGKVWQWVLSSEEFAAVRQDYLVSGTLRYCDGIHARIVSPDQPHPSARAVAPSLEDAYLYLLSTMDGAS